MIELAIAVLAASLLGSLHCVGMCGPLALWASGAGDARSGLQVWSKLISYHIGRLTTYTLGGLAAGTVGSILSTGGSIVGLQSAAARIVGGLMIAFGLIRFAEVSFPKLMSKSLGDRKSAVSGFGDRITRWITNRRPLIQRLPSLARGFAAGALTTLLPCGWLYVFVLVAAGTGAVLPAVAVMFAFWMGTLPALTALVAGSFGVASKIRPALPMLGCLLLLGTGLYTATGRAAADLSPLTERASELSRESTSATKTLERLSSEPLPCCVEVQRK